MKKGLRSEKHPSPWIFWLPLVGDKCPHIFLTKSVLAFVALPFWLRAIYRLGKIRSYPTIQIGYIIGIFGYDATATKHDALSIFGLMSMMVWVTLILTSLAVLLLLRFPLPSAVRPSSSAG